MLNCSLQNYEHYIKRTYFPLFRYYIGICICVSAYILVNWLDAVKICSTKEVWILYNIAVGKLYGIGK